MQSILSSNLRFSNPYMHTHQSTHSKAHANINCAHVTNSSWHNLWRTANPSQFHSCCNHGCVQAPVPTELPPTARSSSATSSRARHAQKSTPAAAAAAPTRGALSTALLADCMPRMARMGRDGAWAPAVVVEVVEVAGAAVAGAVRVRMRPRVRWWEAEGSSRWRAAAAGRQRG